MAAEVQKKEESKFSLHTPVGLFLEPCKMELGAIDLQTLGSVFQDNWIDTVRDLRFLVQERCLNELGLPQSLVGWITNEITSKSYSDKPITEKLKSFIYDQRHNRGIVYYFGTNCGKDKTWRNPADSNLIKITYSSIMHDSAPVNKIFGSETLRIVTKPNPKSWFAFNFTPYKIKPSAYMVRHYQSWDTEALRNWNFEGSNDGVTWDLIKEHKQDSSLRQKGQEFVWNVECEAFYSHFRLFQTGPNSNRHHYLAMSGFEIWGDLKDDKTSGSNVFTHVSDFDNNGIVYWLGTKKGSAPWKNPARIGQMNVYFSSLANDSEPAYCAVGDRIVRCVSEPKANQWLTFDFMNIKIIPTHYTVRHYASFDTECLRNWEFQGSNDSVRGHDGRWETIMRHQNDTNLEGKGGTFTWAIPPAKVNNRSWSKFRLLQTGPNSNNHHYLACSGFDIYGTVIPGKGGRAQPPKPEIPPVVEQPKPVEAVAGQGMGGGQPLPQDHGKRHFKFQSHGDFEGLVYWLATQGKRQPHRNPAQAGLIRVTSSSKMNDSQPLYCAVGRESVRCVTKPAENSWMAFDFGEVSIRPTHYAVRHYSSWDTEALRFWCFEGSTDKINWVQIRRHDNDASLQQAGQWFTWEVQCTHAFKHFRLRMLGPNSNNHFYLACSGFEIYGFASGPGVTSQQISKGPEPKQGDVLFQHVSNMDTNGLFYYLGTKGFTQPWQNPAELGEVSCRCSALMADSAPINTLVGRKPVRIVSKPTRGAWMSVSLQNYVIKVNAYTLRHYCSWDTEAIRNWRLEGSLDGVTWDIIREHRNDTSLNQKSQPFTWRVECAKYYSKFRVLQFDKNSNHHLYLALSGMEIYGDVAKQHDTAVWDNAANNKSNFLAVDERKNVVSNNGSTDSWQTCKAKGALPFISNPVQEFSILVEKSEPTTNSWRFIAGVAPVEFQCSGAKQWLGSQSSWGYIAGTGGKCYNVGKSENYGMKWIEAGTLVTCVMDKNQKTISFLVNGKPQNVAFSNLKIGNGVTPAISMTGKGSSVRLMKRITHYGDNVKPVAVNKPPPRVSSVRPSASRSERGWNNAQKSKQLTILRDGVSVRNMGSNDTWTCCVGSKVYKSGVQNFEVVMTEDPSSTNTWKSIVGVVPATFRVNDSAWIGSQNSWGYISGTGGKCHKVGKSEIYGHGYGKGDRIKVVMDFNRKTLEFFKNGKSQGVAYSNLVGPVLAAVSLTGTGAVATLNV